MHCILMKKKRYLLDCINGGFTANALQQLDWTWSDECLRMWLCAWCAAEQNRFVATNHADCRIVEEKIHQRNCVCNFDVCSWKRSHINTNQCVIMFFAFAKFVNRLSQRMTAKARESLFSPAICLHFLQNCVLCSQRKKISFSLLSIVNYAAA